MRVNDRDISLLKSLLFSTQSFNTGERREEKTSKGGVKKREKTGKA